MQACFRARRILFALTTMLASTACSALVHAGEPLQIYILAGQSNMQGHAHVRTIDAMRLNPAANALLPDIRTEDGRDVVCEQVWISSVGSAEEEQTGKLTTGFGTEARGPKIGPEFTFGLFMEKELQRPILIIKTAWGGKSLNTDFRPPSGGAYEFNEQQLANFEKQGKDVGEIRAAKQAATGHYYRLMIEHIEHVLQDIPRVVPEYAPEQGYELAGFVWFQGWNDMVDRGTYPTRDQPGGYDLYSEMMAHFIRDVRRDLDAPELPFVIGVLGVGGPTDKYGPDQMRYKPIHDNFRDAMAAPASLPEFQGNVLAVRTEAYWDMQVVALRKRERELKPQVDACRARQKSGELTREACQAEIDALFAEAFDERELEILRESVSNAEFHYLGSAGIMAQIGKGFAEAMLELR